MIGCEKIQIKTSYFPPLSFDKDLKNQHPTVTQNIQEFLVLVKCIYSNLPGSLSRSSIQIQLVHSFSPSNSTSKPLFRGNNLIIVQAITI